MSLSVTMSLTGLSHFFNGYRHPEIFP